MFNRSISARSASSIFYEEFNDVDIYIEDTAPGYRKIFKELLTRALGGEYKIDQIFPLGNKDSVISECEKDQASDRKRVYIVDGDYTILNGDIRNDLRGLFTLPRYCIENYFFCEQSILQTANEEEAEMELDMIADNLAFDNWISDNEPLLLELFIIYAICYRYIPEEQTVGFKVTRLCSSNSGIVCQTKIQERISYLKEKLIQLIGDERLRLEIQIIEERIRDKDKKMLRYVSGKDYLLPLMITRLQSFLRFSSNSTSIRLRLAMKSDVEELKVIMDYIIQ